MGEPAPPPALSPGARARAANVPCAGCGSELDPLRAERVAIFSERFHYFCSARCREGFVPRSLPPPPLTRDSVRRAAPSAPAMESARPTPEAASAAPAPLPWRLGLWVPAVLGSAAALAGISGTLEPRWLAPSLALGACITLAGKVARRSQSPLKRAALFRLGAPAGATFSCLLAAWVAPSVLGLAAGVAGLVCALADTSLSLAEQLRRRGEPERARMREALSLPGRDALARGSKPPLPRDLAPGEAFVLEAGERAPVDAVIAAGQAQVEPWFGATLAVSRTEGEAVLAGARVTEGAVRGVVRWAGHDRAWARLTEDPKRRVDVHAATAKLARRASTTGAAVAALAGGMIALLTDRDLLTLALYAAASFAAIANTALAELIALHLERALHRLLAHGIVLRTPAAFDRAGRITRVVFCAEGSLLSGELEVASIEPATGTSTEELLGLVTGAYAGLPGPVSRALARSAQAHQVRADATRSPEPREGLGVSAVASDGRALVVGTRALLLEQRISVAALEARIGELEALGRSVLLVALDARSVGLIALQHNLARGARPAVQRLLDSGIEPVFLSAETRETSSALSRALGIDHVRPEILPAAVSEEIRRLSQMGARVAVIGRSEHDDAALAAASLSINIDPKGGPLERWDIDIASEQVKDAALAITLSREREAEAEWALLAVLVPACAGLVLLVFGLPAWALPLAAALGVGLAWHRIGGSGSAR